MLPIVFSVDYPSQNNSHFHCYNNRSASWSVKASPLKKTIGSCALKGAMHPVHKVPVNQKLIKIVAPLGPV